MEAALLGLVPAGSATPAGCSTSAPAPVACWNCSARECARALGIDASKAMLALARARLARAGVPHCAVRLADMYRLPLADARFDLVVLQMVLHHAEDPRACWSRRPGCCGPAAG